VRVESAELPAADIAGGILLPAVGPSRQVFSVSADCVCPHSDGDPADLPVRLHLLHQIFLI
jgi:hypothetical protein